MNEAIKERISALADGELSEFETRRVLEEINSNPELKDYWTRLQIIKSSFKDQSLGFLSKDISKRVASELHQKVERKEKFIPKNKMRTYVACTVTTALALIVSTAVFNVLEEDLSPEELFASEASRKIADAVSSPQAMLVLDKALRGMDVTLQDLISGNKGQIYANYRVPSNGKTFRVSLSPASSSLNDFSKTRAPKLAFIETREGIYVISVSGDISSEQKSKILRNANFSLNKLN